MTALVVKTLAVLASGSWVPVPAPDPAPVHDPFPKHHPKPKPDPAPMRSALASWYADDGPGACGYGAQSGLRFASLILRCGTRIRICHAGCVTATMSMRQPPDKTRIPSPHCLCSARLKGGAWTAAPKS